MIIDDIIRKYKIDNTKEEYKSFPDTLNGEILLEELYDDNGVFQGYLTINEDKFREIYSDPNHDFTKSGHQKIKNKLEKEFGKWL